MSGRTQWGRWSKFTNFSSVWPPLVPLVAWEVLSSFFCRATWSWWPFQRTRTSGGQAYPELSKVFNRWYVWLTRRPVEDRKTLPVKESPCISWQCVGLHYLVGAPDNAVQQRAHQLISGFHQGNVPLSRWHQGNADACTVYSKCLPTPSHHAHSWFVTSVVYWKVTKVHKSQCLCALSLTRLLWVSVY